ncbi:PAS domain S-box protein [Tamlana sp. 62-3]|uniref:histidine kinase n=1 Tax=Neotamlana sargassicola TaxID=2883125 RepID=A0A9X1I762_9FLAO|nr:PAS domain S-box protein [Tamlana sargassicola]MCB4809085.1 PAS domain S-box protein [Tamlana sargassicola]
MITPFLILFLQCFLVSSILCFIFWFRKKLGLAFLFTAIGVFQFLQIFLADTFYINLFPGIVVSPGTFILFYATLFSLLLVYQVENIKKARSLIYAILVANIFLAIFQYSLKLYFIDDTIFINKNHLPYTSLTNSRITITGTILFAIDSIFIFILYELFSNIFRHLFFRVLVSMALVLILDNLLFKIFGLNVAFTDFKFNFLLPPILSALFYSIFFSIYIYFFENYNPRKTGVISSDIYTKMFDISNVLSEQQDLTEKNLLFESQLNEYSKQIELASKIAKLAYWEFDLTTNHFILNNLFIKLLKLSPSSSLDQYKLTLNEYLEKFIPENHRHIISEGIKNILFEKKSNYSYITEHPIIFGDGSRGTISVTIFIEKNTAGDFKKVYGVSQDITHLKNIQKSLESSEKRFKALVENAVDAVTIINKDGKPIYASPAMSGILGYSNKEILYLSLSENVHPDDLDKVKNAFNLSLNKPGIEIAKPLSKWKRKDGKWVWLKGVFKNMIHDPSINGIIDNFSEVTDVVAYQNELKNQSSLLELLLEISTEYINVPTESVNQSIDKALKDLGKFVNADRAYIFSYDFTNKVSNNTHEWVANGIMPEINNLQNIPVEALGDWVETHKKGMHIYIEDVRALKNKNVQDILDAQGIKSLLTIPIMDNGHCIGFIGFDSVKTTHQYSEKEILLLTLFAEMICNFTNKITKKEELDKLVKTTTKQNQKLLDFSFMISHNIRAYVANIIGLTSIIYENDKDNEFTQMLDESVTKLDYTIKNINDLLIFQNENNVLELKRCSINESIKNVLSQLNNIIKQNNIEIELNIEDSQDIQAIPAYLESIFHNLITNAINYGINETNKKIAIKSKTFPNFILLTIEDFGAGIDLEDNEDKLFNLGSRFHENSKGLGLGLFTTKSYIETLGGSITVKSTPGKGTIFILNFPL